MTRCIIRSFTAFGFRQAQDDRWKKRASEIYGRRSNMWGVAEILYAKVLTILQFACKIKQK